MLGKYFRFLSVSLTVAALAAGCVDQETSSLLGPDSAEFSKSSGSGKSEGRGQGHGKGESGKKARGRVVSGRGADGTEQNWVLATAIVPNHGKAEGVIGRAGGTLVSNGHVLVVPRGAVSEPTNFKIQPYSGSQDGEVPVAVSLKATRMLPSGDVIDVGEQGFSTPVQLYLSYVWAYETYEMGLEGATILWVKPSGVAEEARTHTVDSQGMWIVAELEHFSDYALAWPSRTYSRY